MELISDFTPVYEDEPPPPVATRGEYPVTYTPEDSDDVIYITKSGAFINFSYVIKYLADTNNMKYVTKITNKFTLTYKNITGQIRTIKCAKLNKAKMRVIVPRFGVFEILNKKYNLANYHTESQIRPGQDASYTWHGQLTSNQKVIYKHLMANCYNEKRVACGSAGCIVNLEAGQGKSYLAAYFIAKFQKKTAIILHSTSLIEQWVKVLHTALGPDVSIGYYYAHKKVLGDIMIMIVDSASHDEFVFTVKRSPGVKKKVVKIPAMEYYSQFGFVIYDECHIYANKTGLKVLNVAQATYMMGLSATPDENPSGFDKLVWWQLGPIVVCNQIPDFNVTAADFKASVVRMMYYGPAEHTKILINKYTELVSNSQTINQICNDPYRSALVIECIKRCITKNLFTFVFADRRAYLSMLIGFLKKATGIDGVLIESDDDYIRIVGGSTAEELDTAEKSARVIFTTYQYMGTGKSIVKMNGLVLATPRKSKMKQYINRIFRLGSDESIHRDIYDICDMKLKMSTQWAKRLEYYKSKEYPIHAEKINYSDLNIDNYPIDENFDSGDDTDPDELDAKEVANITASIKARFK